MLDEPQTQLAPTDEAPHPAGPNSRAAASAVPLPEPSAPPPAEPPAPESPISVIRSRMKVSANGNGNGNGNGHANGNGNGNGNGGTYAPAPPAFVPQLRLYLPRTSDLDADVVRMHRIDRILRQSEGDANVILHIANGETTVLLQPRHKVRCSEDLIGALRGELGSERVVLEQ